METTVTLRVTTVFRREDHVWHVVHVQVDTVTAIAPAMTVDSL